MEPPARTEYLTIDFDYLDLDTGAVKRDQYGQPINPNWDVRIVPDYGQVDTYYVEQNLNNWTMIGHLVGATYENVTFEDAFYAPLHNQVLTQAIGTDRTIVIQTADFRIFKIGNAYFDFYCWRYHFDYVELTP